MDNKHLTDHTQIEPQEIAKRLDRLEQSVGVLIAIYLNTGGPSDSFGYLKRGRHSQHFAKFKELVNEVDDVRKLIDLFLRKE